MAVSLYHQGGNIDRERMRQLTGQLELAGSASSPPSMREWLLSWIDRDASPQEELDSLPGVMWHLSDAWARQVESNVVLVHYDDLATNLEGAMRGLATLLGIAVPEKTWPDLVEAATFERMRTHADSLAPDPAGVLKDKKAFFRRGTSGSDRELLTNKELDHYHARAAEMASAGLLAWLHREHRTRVRLRPQQRP